MAIDDFQGRSGRNDPIWAAVTIDYSAGDQVLAHMSRKIYISTAGDLTVQMANGNDQLWPALPVGWHDIQCQAIRQTGSTAAGVVGW